jgi:neutral ceramidase
VTPTTLEAGGSEAYLDIPVGVGLGGYTARANFLGSFDPVDNRVVPIAREWQATVGVETKPRVKAVALRTGVETVLWLKVDAIFAYEDWVYELERRLGPEYRGKIMISTSHSHSAFSQFTGHSPLKVGSGEFREIVNERFDDAMETAARAAINNLQPAKIGFFSDIDFDPNDAINRERRGENDDLPGGNRKDDQFRMIRIDSMSGTPIAIIAVVGMHPVLNDADNPLASTDAVGQFERLVEERFDRAVTVMHIQSAGADTSAAGHGGLDCNVHPGASTDPCFHWLSAEGHGRAAVDTVMAAWTSAGTSMSDQLALSMVTQSVELGPYADTYRIRDGALTYAPFDLSRNADGVVWNGTQIVSPIDEYNAPVGAALCENPEPMFPAAAIPGTEGVPVYGSCVRMDVAGDILGQILGLTIDDVSEAGPACGTTRTTVSVLRLGDYIVPAMPGELSVLLADKIRAASPVDAVHTIAIGYSQGHIGYCLTAEDWLHGGYESSVTFGGPLEAEMVAEKLVALMPQAMAATRPDAAAAGTTRVVIPVPMDSFPQDNPAPQAGTVPATVSADLWMRGGRPATAQPPTTVPRVTGLATFVWQGDDPLTKTPIVMLQKETSPGSGTYNFVLRNSGRIVIDGDLILTYAPSPLIRESGPQTHLWAVEWQPVPWTGDRNGLDALDKRGAVPLGKYRFHVIGANWTLDSDPFDVVAGTLTIAASRAGNVVTVASNWNAPKGYRLMDVNQNSNVPVPLRTQSVTVSAFAGAAPVGTAQTMTTDAQGRVTIDYGAAASTITRVDVTDGFSNTGTSNL